MEYFDFGYIIAGFSGAFTYALLTNKRLKTWNQSRKLRKKFHMEWKEKERQCGFPCGCGAKDYEDAADKCQGIGDQDVCPAACMFENHIAIDNRQSGENK